MQKTKVLTTIAIIITITIIAIFVMPKKQESSNNNLANQNPVASSKRPILERIEEKVETVMQKITPAKLLEKQLSTVKTTDDKDFDTIPPNVLEILKNDSKNQIYNYSQYPNYDKEKLSGPITDENRQYRVDFYSPIDASFNKHAEQIAGNNKALQLVAPSKYSTENLLGIDFPSEKILELQKSQYRMNTRSLENDRILQEKKILQREFHEREAENDKIWLNENAAILSDQEFKTLLSFDKSQIENAYWLMAGISPNMKDGDYAQIEKDNEEKARNFEQWLKDHEEELKSVNGSSTPNQ